MQEGVRVVTGMVTGRRKGRIRSQMRVNPSAKHAAGFTRVREVGD